MNALEDDDDDDRDLKELLTRPAEEVDDIDLVDAVVAARAPAAPAVVAAVSRRPLPAAPWLASAGAAAAIALFIAFAGFGKRDEVPRDVVPRDTVGEGGELRAKGDDDGGGGGLRDKEGVEVFVVDDGGVPRRVAAGARMHAREGLAFAIVGAPAFEYVLIYAVDDDKRVFWFYPEVTRGSVTSVKAEPGELPDVIRNDDLRAGKLTVHALLSHAPITTTSTSAPAGAPAGDAAASDISIVVEVLP